MSNVLDEILSGLGTAAKLILPNIVPGASALINAGGAISSAITSIKEAGATSTPSTDAAHEALMAKVKAHADSTLSRLEGGS